MEDHDRPEEILKRFKKAYSVLLNLSHERISERSKTIMAMTRTKEAEFGASKEFEGYHVLIEEEIIHRLA